MSERRDDAKVHRLRHLIAGADVQDGGHAADVGLQAPSWRLGQLIQPRGTNASKPY
jgi:hypothetical protein